MSQQLNSSGAETPSQKLIIASDFHFPFNCRYATEKFIRIVKEVQPNTVILLGDIVDFYSLSRFRKNPARMLQLGKEIRSVGTFFDALRSVSDGQIFYLQGNHEERLFKFISDHAPQLYVLHNDKLSIAKILNLDEYRIKYISNSDGLQIGPIRFLHSNLIRKDPGKTVLELLNRCRKNVVTGHSHRLAIIYVTIDGKNLMGIECGCMTNPQYHDYISYPFPNWTKGCVFLELNGKEIKQTRLIPL